MSETRQASNTLRNCSELVWQKVRDRGRVTFDPNFWVSEKNPALPFPYSAKKRRRKKAMHVIGNSEIDFLCRARSVLSQLTAWLAIHCFIEVKTFIDLRFSCTHNPSHCVLCEFHFLIHRYSLSVVCERKYYVDNYRFTSRITLTNKTISFSAVLFSMEMMMMMTREKR